MHSKIYVLAFIVLVIIYIGFIFGMPTDTKAIQRYDITESQVRFINLTVVTPLIFIWFTALYGFLKLKSYARSVANAREGRAFHYLMLGLMVLTFSLPINAIASSLVRYSTLQYPDLLVLTTILRNYLTVVLSIAAFWLLVVGGRALVNTVSKLKLPDIPKGFTAGITILTAVYAWLITSKPLNQGEEERAYFLPGWLMIFTIVVPYVLAWKAGFLTTYYLYKYHEHVKGVIYKSAFRDLAMGICFVVVIAILVQLITTSSAQLNRLNLTPILLIIYGLLIMYIVGFGLVARGAKKLKRLEDV